jgi:hypothetical protein
MCALHDSDIHSYFSFVFFVVTPSRVYVNTYLYRNKCIYRIYIYIFILLFTVYISCTEIYILPYIFYLYRKKCIYLTYLYICINHASAHVYVYIYIHINTHTLTHHHAQTPLFVHTYTYTNTHIHTHVNLHTLPVCDGAGGYFAIFQSTDSDCGGYVSCLFVVYAHIVFIVRVYMYAHSLCEIMTMCVCMFFVCMHVLCVYVCSLCMHVRYVCMFFVCVCMFFMCMYVLCVCVYVLYVCMYMSLLL